MLFLWQVGSISEFIVDDIIDDDEEEEEEDESEYNHFESLCAICDDGGELLWYVLSLYNTIPQRQFLCLACVASFVESTITYLNCQFAKMFYLILFSLLYVPLLVCLHPD